MEVDVFHEDLLIQNSATFSPSTGVTVKEELIIDIFGNTKMIKEKQNVAVPNLYKIILAKSYALALSSLSYYITV